MTLNHENKNYVIVEGFHIVSSFPGGIKCVNCYIEKNTLCDYCLCLDYETKKDTMSWNEFKSQINPDIIIRICNKFPDNYKEYIDLYNSFIERKLRFRKEWDENSNSDDFYTNK